jgi:hypothetical protein
MAEPTGLFLADAEENDLLEWTGTEVHASNTLAASADYKLHGNYSFKAVYGGGNYACGYYTHGSDLTESYCRAYFRIDTLTIADNTYLHILTCRESRWGDVVWQFRLAGTGTAGQYGYLFMVADDSGLNIRVNERDSNIFQDDTDFYIEAHFKQGNGNGVEELWINGASIYSASTITNTNYVTRTFRAGGDDYSDTPTSGTLYFDDCKVDSSYIGAYSAGGSTTPAKMMHYARFRNT